MTFRARGIVLTLLALIAMTALTAAADGRMRSDKINKNLCVTTGGGKFVPIPGFPGETIDRRLLSDIRYLVRRYDIFITDGYSNDPVHAANGEHPIGLALDIVPNKAIGGSWKEIGKLAKRAEPAQNQPISPFRWVGWNGDAGHGRGHHLHLSWNHSATTPGKPAKTVYTLRCPGSGGDGGGGTGGKGGGGDGSGGKGGGGKGGNNGGVKPGGGGKGGSGSGGVQPRIANQAADPVAETGGVDLEP